MTSLRITAKGRALEPVFKEISDRMNAAVYRGLPEDEAQHMAGRLRQMLEQLDRGQLKMAQA